jgi:hypothetical protein
MFRIALYMQVAAGARALTGETRRRRFRESGGLFREEVWKAGWKG